MDTVKAATKIYDSDTGVYFVYHGETDIDMVVGLAGTIDGAIGNATIPAGHVSGLSDSIGTAIGNATIPAAHVSGLSDSISTSISNATIPASHVVGLSDTVILGTTASTVKGAIWLVDD